MTKSTWSKYTKSECSLRCTDREFVKNTPVTPVFKITRLYSKTLKCHFVSHLPLKIANVNKRDFKPYFICKDE